tara:strand:+ start:143 stop:553 length:411 start_codon:yes stop_codon:yes gene_type:complete
MYNVGQLLYVILNKRQRVIPVQVIEQVVRRSLQGEETHYSVNVPGKNGVKPYNLHDLDGEVYESVEDAKEALIENANRSITHLVESAQKIAKHVFDSSDDDSLVFDSSKPQLEDDEESVKITLENGTIANVKMPSM